MASDQRRAVILPSWNLVLFGYEKMSAEKYRLRYPESRFVLTPGGNDLLERIEYATVPSVIDLVALSVRELGFAEGACYAAICERAHGLGLELCPAEVGPALRLRHLRQKVKEWLVIAMKPVPVPGRQYHLFYLWFDSVKLRLDGTRGEPDMFWHPDYVFVFMRPRVKPKRVIAGV